MIRTEGVVVNDAKEAETLMFHHLEIAAALFEVSGANLPIPPSHFSQKAMSKWLDVMDNLYPKREVK